MASSSFTSKILGYSSVNLKFYGHNHNNVKLLILDNLCSDAILGQDILSKHSSYYIFILNQISWIFQDCYELKVALKELAFYFFLRVLTEVSLCLSMSS